MATFLKNDTTGEFLYSYENDLNIDGYTALVANSVDAAQEKHVPAIELQRDGNIIKVAVGSVDHPMEPEHYIEWVALAAAGRLEVHRLKPGQTPLTFFSGGVRNGTVYAYCNLHGLWKASF